MAVFIPIPVETIQDAKELPSLTYRLDLDAGRIVGFVDRLDAVNQAIRKAIITPRFKCLIYDSQYGSEIEEAIIAESASQQYVIAAIEGFVRDCLKPDTRIKRLYDFIIELTGERCYLEFKADTIYGNTTIKEVI